MKNRKTFFLTVFIWMMPLVFLPLPLSVAKCEGGYGTVEIRDHGPEAAAEEIGAEEYKPFIPDDLEKTVFGKNDSITVSNPASYPFSAIAYMEVTGKCGCDWTASGYMVGTDKMLTAAHCLFCTEHWEQAEKIIFYFGYKNRRNYMYKYAGGWQARTGNDFSNHEYSPDMDYACIRLEKKIGEKVGCFGILWDLSDSEISSQRLYIAGYRDGRLAYDSGRAEAKDTQHIIYRMDTVPGTSGGLIYTGDYYAIGINIAESEQHNIGYRLGSEVREDLDGI